MSITPKYRGKEARTYRRSALLVHIVIFGACWVGRAAAAYGLMHGTGWWRLLPALWLAWSMALDWLNGAHRIGKVVEERAE